MILALHLDPSRRTEIVMIVFYVLAKMYNRENFPQDPHVSIRDYQVGKERQMVYTEGGMVYSELNTILNYEGGMNVFIRKK